MDREQSIAHVRRFIEEAEKRCVKKAPIEFARRFKEVWNEWADPLIAEREWDDEKEEYRKEATSGWKERAELDLSYVHFFCGGKDCATSPSSINFSGIRIIDFSLLKYPGRAVFLGNFFENDCWFSGVKFLAGAIFADTTFEGTVNFSDTVFVDRVEFTGASFAKDVNFLGAKFEGFVDLSNVTFGERVAFVDVFFKTGASFLNTVFKKLASFDNTHFQKETSFDLATFESAVDFNGATFVQSANFTALHSKRSFSLTETTFQRVPNFTSHRFDHLPCVDNMKVDVPEFSRPDKGNEAKYRALKAMAVQAHDHRQEMDFFAEELKCKGGFWQWMYGQLSDYGRSILWPVFCWFWTIAIFSAAYMAIGKPEFWQALMISVKNASLLPNIMPFGETNELFANFFGIHKNPLGGVSPDIPRLYYLLAIMQTFVFILLIFLFGHAVRNRFRIK